VSERVLIDTGPIVAALVQSDEHHAACSQQLRTIRGPLVTCWPVITEAAWLLRAYPNAIERMLASLDGRVFLLADLSGDDAPAIASILSKYRNLGLQLADASLIHLAEREHIGTVFTLDRRDFSVVRLPRGKKLRLIP
jgi:predicted nucleic acid-binding protein